MAEKKYLVTLNMGGNKVSSLGYPGSATDAASKSYVDTQDNKTLKLTGGKIIGPFTVNATNAAFNELEIKSDKSVHLNGNLTHDSGVVHFKSGMSVTGNFSTNSINSTLTGSTTRLSVTPIGCEISDSSGGANTGKITLRGASTANTYLKLEHSGISLTHTYNKLAIIDGPNAMTLNALKLEIQNAAVVGSFRPSSIYSGNNQVLNWSSGGTVGIGTTAVANRDLKVGGASQFVGTVYNNANTNYPVNKGIEYTGASPASSVTFTKSTSLGEIRYRSFQHHFTGAMYGGAATFTGNVIGKAPTSSTHLTTKGYVDVSHTNKYLPKGGGTLTGTLTGTSATFTTQVKTAKVLSESGNYSTLVHPKSIDTWSNAAKTTKSQLTMNVSSLKVVGDTLCSGYTQTGLDPTYNAKITSSKFVITEDGTGGSMPGAYDLSAYIDKVGVHVASGNNQPTNYIDGKITRGGNSNILLNTDGSINVAKGIKSGNTAQHVPFKFWRGTQVQYDALATKDATTQYNIVG